jgi:hypothetical protein
MWNREYRKHNDTSMAFDYEIKVFEQN